MDGSDDRHSPAPGDATGTSPAITSTSDLARALKWWTRHGPRGRTKVAALAQRAGVSTSTLYAYLSGATLPPSGALDDLLLTLEVPAGEHRRLATARDALQQARRAEDADVVPQELPPGPSVLTGRRAAVAELDEFLHEARVPAGEPGGGPSVAVLSGAAGVGKTALAVHWAHAHVDDFPGGTLYADLRGFSPGEPAAAGTVLAALLRSLGLEAHQIPDDVGERSARLRSRLAGRRALLVLDNALDVEQVRPLLPGDRATLVVVTSRRLLEALAVDPGSRRVGVPPLAPGEAAELVASHTPGAVSPVLCRALADNCGGLPLALRIVAARVASDPDGVDRVLDDLVSLQGLDGFDLGDATTSVRAVFSWSESRLTPDQARAFVLLGVLPVDDLDALGAAALWDVDVRAARSLLDALHRAHLVQPLGAGRYGLHDLLREHVRERAASDVDADVRRDHQRRLVQQSVTTAADLATSAGEGSLAGEERLLQWVADRWTELLTLLDLAAAEGWWDLVDPLADALNRQLDVGGHHRDARSLLTHALTAARRLGHREHEAKALRSLGVAAMKLGDHASARNHLQEALLLARTSGLDLGVAGALNDLGNLEIRLGDHVAARTAYAEALVIARELGFEPGEATLLTNLGFTDARAGDVDEALAHCTTALQLFTDHDDAPGMARTLGNLGDIHRRAGRLGESQAAFEEGLARARAISAGGIEIEILNGLGCLVLAAGDPERAREVYVLARTLAVASVDAAEEARAWAGLGDVEADADDLEAAVAHWHEAWTIWDRLGLPEAEEIRARISAPTRR